MTSAFTYNYSDDFDFNSNDRSQQTFVDFQSGEIVNEYELMIIDILEIVLGDRFRYCPQVPLEVICRRPENLWLPKEVWQFLVSSKVDIAVMERGYCANRQAKLVVECQSHYHDLLSVQVCDRKKARLLAAVSIPLIYVRRVDEDRRFYRFYTPDEKEVVLYNLITQEGRTDLEQFLGRFL